MNEMAVWLVTWRDVWLGDTEVGGGEEGTILGGQYSGIAAESRGA